MLKKWLMVVGATSLIATPIIDFWAIWSSLVTVPAGFFPSFFVTLLVWLFTYAISLLYAESILSLPDGSNFFSLTSHYFGRYAGRILSFLFFLTLIYYIYVDLVLLLPFLQNFLSKIVALHLPIAVITILFFLFIGAIIWWGLLPTVILSSLLLVGFLSVFFDFTRVNFQIVDLNKIVFADWIRAFPLVSIFAATFGFQGIVPTVVTFLKRDRKLIHTSLFFGLFISFLALVILDFLILGSVADDQLWQAAQLFNSLSENTVQFEKIFVYLNMTPYVIFYGSLSAVLISVYVLTNLCADFRKAELEKCSGKRRLYFILSSIVPPLFIFFLFPNYFSLKLDQIFDLFELFLAFVPLIAVWIIRYQLQSPIPRLLAGGKFFLFFLFFLIFFFIWFQGLSLIR